MEYPSVILCPKNPDAVNETTVMEEIADSVPEADNVTAALMLAYVIADAGFANMDKKLRPLDAAEHERIQQLIMRWRGGASALEFYQSLFGTHGFKCQEVGPEEYVRIQT